MTKVLMFAGPGTSGKTSLLEAIEKLGVQRGLSIRFMKSTTRKSYAEAGKDNEQAALTDPNNPEFQNNVMFDFCNSTLEFLKEVNGKCDLAVIDRSPYDYASYYLTVFAPTLKIDTIVAKRNIADGYMAQYGQQCSELVVMPLPWPMPWSKDAESSDGWRADKTGKNFLWSSVLMSELQEAFRRPLLSSFRYGVNAGRRLQRLVPFAETGGIEVRAANTLAALFPDHHGTA